jgi:hypothetical protein
LVFEFDVINKKSKDVKKPGEPGDHEDDMKGFEPKIEIHHD